MVGETAEIQFKNYLEKLIDNALNAGMLPNDITDIINVVLVNRENIRRSKLGKALGIEQEPAKPIQTAEPEEPIEQELASESVEEIDEPNFETEEAPDIQPNKVLSRDQKIALLRAKKNFKV